jgi:alpha-beta hydrolase superfamily lysophospholipase
VVANRVYTMNVKEDTEFVEDEAWGSGRTRLRVVTSTAGVAVQDRAKPMVLLLHGAGHNSLVWGRCAAGLAQHGYRVFSFDFRHHGETTVGEADPTAALPTPQVAQLAASDEARGGAAAATASAAPTPPPPPPPPPPPLPQACVQGAATASAAKSAGACVDLDIATLVSDTAIVLRHVRRTFAASPNQRVCLVGHSLGGSVAVHTCVKHSSWAYEE